MRLLLSIALLFVLAAAPAHGQDTGLGLLRVAPDAAGGALADARVAASRDAFSTLWNPAGLAAASRNSAAISHRIWVADVRSYAVAARFRAGQRGGLGLAVLATDLGDFEARQQPGDPDGLFSVSSLSIGASYGRRLGPLRAGATVRYLSEQIFEASANGYAVDAGVQLDLLSEKLTLGAALQNAGQMTELETRATRLPTTLRAGATFSPLRLLSEDADVLLDVTLAAEVSHDVPNEATRLHAGTAAVFDLVSIRLGYLSDDELRSLTGGIGLAVGGLVFDYALLRFASGFDGPGHLLTLHYTW